MAEDQVDDVVAGVGLRVVLDMLPEAIIVTDGDGRIVLWNAEAERLYGWSEAEVIGRTTVEVLMPVGVPPALEPDLVQPDGEALLARALAGEPYRGDRIVVRRGGDPVRVLSTTRAVFDSDGNVAAVVGASEDITETRLREHEAQQLTENLRLAIDAGGLGTWRWDMATDSVTWDERMEELFGFDPGSFDGTFEAYQAALHPDDRAATLATVQAAVRSRQSYRVQHRARWADGSIHWISGAGNVTVDQDGNVTGAIGCSMDVTAQMEVQLEREMAAALEREATDRERVHGERLRLLSDINDALLYSGTRREIMERVTQAAVPRLGDWCSIYVVDPGSPLPEIETAPVDPAMADHARELMERFPFDPNAPTGMPRVIRSGEPEFYPELTEQLIDDLVPVDEVRDVVRELAVSGAIAVPLIKHGRILGGLQFVMARSSRTYTEDDLALAQVVAGRVASSLENTRLAEKQRLIASTLQDSLLPKRLPEIPRLEIAVRYWAAGEGTEVGGDFYDVFATDDQRWVAVIGDVCGNGPSAASMTALARHSLRQAAWRGDPPDRVLHWLNFALLEADGDSFLTTAYATITAAAAEGFDVEVTAAGHPLPVLVRADGAAHTVGRPGSLVGVFDTINVRPVAEPLRPGDTLVLYTDGVTDVPPPHHLTAGQVETMMAEAARGATDAEAIATRIQRAIADVLPLEDRDDDIALLVLHAPADPSAA